ncbi:hypothetical protein RvY_16805 [Ramazzottius varieornatus]|uniref:Uncharacterized protein n=1 Tax=Ramazzottius varieornatus TaxID=947166 RepID=A0A1D1W631_RAMVA|nr:hypothetical protein RvY_16805 [Ramazzottius varieornatus]
MSDSEDEMMGCESHRSERHVSCVQCYPAWMFQKTGQFCLGHYLYYPNTVCSRALFCHVAAVVPPEESSGFRIVTRALRSLCLSITQQGCGFSVRRWMRDFRTSFVARNIRYRGERFWRVYPGITGEEGDVSEETRLKDWRGACADFYPMADDHGESGLLSPIQASPDTLDVFVQPYHLDGYAADDEGKIFLGGNGSTNQASSDRSSSSSASLSDVFDTDFIDGYRPYRRFPW